jgi:hypothetical protein
MTDVPATPKRRDFPAWIYITSFFVIVLIALLPIFTMIVAVSVANAYGCQITEGVVSPCMIGGSDYGSLLQAGGISFWYLLFTMPLGFVLFVIWLIVFLIHLARFGKRRKVMAT